MGVRGSALLRLLAAALLSLAAVAPLRAQPAPSAAPSAPAPQQPAGPLPVEALAALPDIESPLLSPDGHRIAARISVDGQTRIAVWDLRQARDARPHLISQGEHVLRWFRWAGPNRLLLGIMTRGRYEAFVVPVTRVVAIDTATWTPRLLNTGRGIIGDDVIFIEPEGRYVIVSSQPTWDVSPAVIRVDLATGTSTEIERPRLGVWNWFVDANGVVRAGVDYSENRIRLYYRAAAGAEFRRIDSRRYPQDGSVIDMIRFVNNTDRGIVVTNAVTGRFGVYSYDFATDTRGDALFEHPSVDVTSAVIGADGELDGVAYVDDRPRIHWIDADYQRLQATLDRALPGKTNQVVNSSNDNQRVLFLSGGADDPGTYYIYDRAARRIQPFMSPYEGLVDRRFAPVRPISFRSRDGTELQGYLTLPQGREPRGLPLVLMPHGGPFARDSWAFDPQLQFLASRGYAVLQVNFRGSTGYGRAFVERGFGQWGSGMIDDLEDGVDWLAREGTVDASRVCIVGSSYGGYAALWAPIRKPERYRCAVSFAGISDVSAMLRHDRRSFRASRYAREWNRRVRGEEESDLQAISPLRQADRIRVPLLIAHGERDTNVLPSQSRDLLRALGRRNFGVESVFYAEAGHGFTRPQDSADFLRRLEAFLARHNPAAAAPAAPAPAAPATAGVSNSPASR
jgi:dipeptidyl aminopeptidase/acylaminoacyl peptidase